MKMKSLLMSLCIPVLALTSCEDEQTTTVSKSLLSGDTIVSRSNSSGSYTRTQYGNDIFGNSTISTSRGHENATQEGDLVVFLLEAAATLLAE